MNCPILILAAGGSTRMAGRDKLLETVGGVPQLRRLCLAALALGEPVFVALPRADHPRAAVIADLGVTILAIAEAAEGMGGTLRVAVAMLPPCPRFMLVLGDMAEIGAAEMRAVLDAARAHSAPVTRGATQDGAHGHPVVFDAGLRPQFAKLGGDSGGEDIVRPLRDQTRLVRLTGQIARLDLDTPQDWAAFRARTGL